MAPLTSFSSHRFLVSLREELAQHPAVHHPFLKRAAAWPWRRDDYKQMALQHYPLVGLFTWYMEQLKRRAPNPQAEQWLSQVLLDEYGEHQAGQDHASLYRQFMTCCGVETGEEDRVVLDPKVVRFVLEHARLVTREPFLVGLGAIGPGHEWSIPTMFEYLLQGLQREFSPQEITYFTLHVKQDMDHGAWLESALEEIIQNEADAALVRKGALLSLEARGRFWDGVQERMLEWRRPARTLTWLDGVRRLTAQGSRLKPSSPTESALEAPKSLPDARMGGLHIVYRPQLRAALGV